MGRSTTIIPIIFSIIHIISIVRAGLRYKFEFRTVTVFATIPCVSQIQGLKRKREMASRSDHTILSRYHYFPVFTIILIIFFTILIKKCNLGSYSFQQSGQSPPPSQGIRVPSKEHQNRLNQGVPKGLLPWQGRQPQRRRPDRHYAMITNVFQPSGAHCRTKLITKVIHSLGNDRSLILPNVIRNTEVDTNLKILKKS
jgi:hypothetical protein